METENRNHFENFNSDNLKDNKKKKDDNSLRSWISSIVFAIVLALLIRTFLFSATVVVGESMQPTLHQSDRLIALKFPLYFKGPSRGDIIILEAPDQKNTEYVKRVIGIPGDKIRIENGEVFLNDQKLDENYVSIDFTDIYAENSWTLSDDEYFVMGDNRKPGKSEDSRYFGPIKKNTIDGIIKLRYWPISRIGSFKI